MENWKIKIHGMIRLILSLLWVNAFIFIAGCMNEEGAEQSKLKVTATIGMIADVVEQVGGEHVEVTALMGEGIDPHVYKASQGDIRKLNEADVIFYNGLHLEAEMAEVLDQIEGKTTVAVAEQLNPEVLIDDPETSGAYDPHVWFDVSLWMEVTEVIRDTLVEVDADNAEAYQEQAEAYLEELQNLDTYAREQIATIPEKSRVLVTAHDAFSYFGRAYDMEVRGLQGISTASEAGVKDVSDLRDFMIEREIRAIFVESSISSSNIEAVIEGAEAKGFTISIGGELYADAMGPEGSEAGTYIGMVQHNVDTIVQALKDQP